jgi:hypothetical protein
MSYEQEEEAELQQQQQHTDNVNQGSVRLLNIYLKKFTVTS